MHSVWFTVIMLNLLLGSKVHIFVIMPSCQHVTFSCAAWNKQFYIWVTLISGLSQQSHRAASSSERLREKRKSRWDASVSTWLSLSLNSHHQGLFQSLWKPERVSEMDPILILSHEWYENKERLFRLAVTKPLLFVCVCVLASACTVCVSENPSGKLIKWFC